MKHATSLAYVLAFVFSAAATAQSDTTFTYQGELTESGIPANGSYNMDFALWDALSGGSQVGTSIQFNGLPVTEGRFGVELDFGTSAFDGSQLWLEIAVDGNELVPRQPITGAPYSIQTRGIVVDANNNVGIGTSTPGWELEVANLAPGDGAESAVTAEDAGGAIAAYSSTLPPPFEHYAGRVSLLSNAVTDGLDLRADASTGDIRFYTGGWPASNERMRISETGNVGIGATATIWQLEVADTTPGGSVESVVSADDAGGGLAAYSSTHPGLPHFADRLSLWSDGVTAAGLDLRADGSTSDIRFYTGGWGVSNERMHISHTGNVGIGRPATGSDRLYVTSDTGVAIGAHVRNGSGVLAQTDSSDGGAGIRGVSTAVSGTSYAVRGQCNSSSGYDFYADGAGQDYGSSSSIRWKSNIEPIDDALFKVAQLRGVHFDWDKEHGGHHDVGMIAEEVGKVLPEIVTYEDNGIDAHGMDYSKLTPLLVEAVNALRAENDAEIDALRAEHDAEIKELAQQLSDLKHLLEQLAVHETEGFQ